MQQRQPRLGDILDDYCPRERRVTNHVVVAMVGPDVKQTRCSTCDADHEYKHAKVPRQRRKPDTPAALYAQTLAGGPKRVRHEPDPVAEPEPAARDEAPPVESVPADDAPVAPLAAAIATDPSSEPDSAADAQLDDDTREADDAEDGPVHRPLIRATLPRTEGQPPPQRPAPEFTIRQPGGRHNRFRPRHQRGGQQFFGNRSNGSMGGGGGMHRQDSGRPPHHHHGQGQGHGPSPSRHSRRHGPKRPK